MERITGAVSYPYHKYFSLNTENNDFFFFSFASLNQRLFQNLTLLMVINFQISSQNVFVATCLFLCQCCLPVWEALLFLSRSIPSCPHPTCSHRQQTAAFLAGFTELMFSSGLSMAAFSSAAHGSSLEFEFLSDPCCASYSRVKLLSAL